jgi:hypothetical protein
MVFLSFSRQLPGCALQLDHDRFLPHTSYLIIHLPFEAVLSLLLTKRR